MFNLKSRQRIKNLKREQAKPTSLITVMKPNSKVAEQFRTLRTNIQFSMVDRQLKTLMFTSATPYEGKSTISANLASAFASQGKKVILVDADMRKPKVANSFHLENHIGLSTLITSSDYQLNDAVQHDDQAHIDILASGPLPPNPSELLNSNRMNAIIQQLEQAYDLVIFDLPPVVSVTDAQVMAAKVDGVVFVIRKDVAYVEDVKQAKILLDMVNANVLGAVFNGEVDSSDRAYSYYGYGHE